MKLGDFFSAVGAEGARPINPKPVKLTLVCKNDVLPNGVANQHRRPIAATGRAAFVFMGGDEVIKTRPEARAFLAELLKTSEDEPPTPTDNWDLEYALRYVQLSKVLYEYDEQTHAVGDPLFPDAMTACKLIGFEEATRLMVAYTEYVKEEHPEEVTSTERAKSKGRGDRVARAASR